jgi:excisionase family DNA binding protein
MANQAAHSPANDGEGSTRSREPFERLWDANDVAAHLNVSRSWVYHRAESGELPCLRVGGLLRFEPEAVRSYARGQIAPASSQASPPRLVPRKRTR